MAVLNIEVSYSIFGLGLGGVHGARQSGGFLDRRELSGIVLICQGMHNKHCGASPDRSCAPTASAPPRSAHRPVPNRFFKNVLLGSPHWALGRDAGVPGASDHIPSPWHESMSIPRRRRGSGERVSGWGMPRSVYYAYPDI